LHGVKYYCYTGLGTALGPIFAAALYYIGDYSLPFYFVGFLMIVCIYFIYNIKILENISDSEVKPDFLKALIDIVINLI
jgi:hypothetical protein